MGLVAHAEHELRGMLAGGEWDRAMAEGVIALVKVFAEQGHSGMSAPAALSMFSRLAAFEPLGPLTGEDDEWNEVMPDPTGKMLWQNRRCSHVFKGADGAYDIDGRVFEDPKGIRFTNADSRVSVTFPYVPRSDILKVDEEGRPLS